MNLSFLSVLVNVAVLVALTVPGFVLKKTRLIESGAQKSLVSVLLFVCQPMLILKSFQAQLYSDGILLHLAAALFIGFSIHLVMYVLSRLCFPFSKSAINRIHSFSTVFANSSFLGIPLLATLFKDNVEVVAYASVYGIAFSLLSWTLGIYIMTGKRGYISVKRAVLNPPTLILLIALPLFFFGISLPGEVMRGVHFLGDMTTPLSMIIIGSRLADVSIKSFCSDYKILLVTALRLIVSPLIMMLALLPFTNESNLLLLKTMIILSSMPIAFTTVLFAERTGGDSKTASVSVIASTVLSTLTIPAVIGLMGLLFNQ